jgi:hypothetical protein
MITLALKLSATTNINSPADAYDFTRSAAGERCKGRRN